MALYTKRLASAISARDLERIDEAAEAIGITASEYIRLAIRAALARDLLGVPTTQPTERPSTAVRRQHERARATV